MNFATIREFLQNNIENLVCVINLKIGQENVEIKEEEEEEEEEEDL